MATQTLRITVSDFSGEELDEKRAATITVKFADGRKGIVIADADQDDKIVKEIIKVGRQQQRRGRQPKK